MYVNLKKKKQLKSLDLETVALQTVWLFTGFEVTTVMFYIFYLLFSYNHVTWKKNIQTKKYFLIVLCIFAAQDLMLD